MRLKSRRPNILIISVCSLRLHNMGLYEYRDRSTTPFIEKYFSKNSLIFDNMFNSQSWTALSAVTQTDISQKYFAFHGYDLLGYRRFNQSFRIPGKVAGKLNNYYTEIVDRNFDKDHRGYFSSLEAKIKEKREKPFFVIAHLKYLHYPLIDRFNKDSGWDRFLDENEKERIRGYLEKPEQFKDKLPIQLYLKNTAHYVRVQPEYSRFEVKYLRPMLGLISNDDFSEKWRASTSFNSDLQIINKVYDANLRYLDKKIFDILNLYGDSELQENTVVILTGDHGEPFMEHGALSHGTTLFDEEFRIPFAVRFPNWSFSTRRITDQHYIGQFSNVLKGIIKGDIHSENFQSEMNSRKSDIVIGRNCTNSKYMARVNNRWKWMLNIETGEQALYDLKKDPVESTDVSKKWPEKTSEIESLFWSKYPEIKRPDHEFCRPWIQ